jgi:hypothetical protein
MQRALRLLLLRKLVLGYNPRQLASVGGQLGNSLHDVVSGLLTAVSKWNGVRLFFYDSVVMVKDGSHAVLEMVFSHLVVSELLASVAVSAVGPSG